MNLFGKREPPPDPSQLAKEWKRKLQKESRDLDRQISNLRREEAKALAECKKLAKGGHASSSKILAKQIVQTRKSIERMYTAKAQMNSIAMQLQTTAAMVKLKENVAKSSEIMATMNGLMNIQEVGKTMRDLAREMEKSGLIDEIVDDAFSSMDPEGLETEADAEVEKILQEITSDIFAKASEAPTAKVATKAAAIATATAVEEAPIDDDDEVRAMQSRLESL